MYMHACIYECMYVCMYVCGHMYVCMYVWYMWSSLCRECRIQDIPSVLEPDFDLSRLDVVERRVMADEMLAPRRAGLGAFFI